MSTHIRIEASVASQPASSALSNSLVALLLAIIAIFYASTLRPGHIWGDDFAMYIHHAKNIVEGRPYADTGYIFNPAAAVGPRMYPPVFPLLLSPIYKLYGLNLIAMKLEQVVFFVLALTAVYLFFKHDLGPEYSLALVAILGFNPIFWAAKDNVLSDLLFLLFLYTAALLVRFRPPRKSGDRLWAGLIGIALYFAIGTRSAGVALVVGLVFFDLFKSHAITRLAVVLSVLSGLLLVQSHFLGLGFHNYDGHLHPAWHSVRNFISYPRALAGFWVASTKNGFSFVLLGIVALLSVAGAYFQYKRGVTIIEAFLAPYIVMLLVLPLVPGIRLAFPLVPWIVFLALYGLRNLAMHFVPRYSTAALCALLLLISIPYALAYHKMDFGPIRESTGLPEFNSLCEAVRERTAPADVLIYYRARALALYTGREASSYNHNGTEQELEHWASSIHANYLITTDAFDEDQGLLSRYVEHHPSDVKLIYQNAHFKLYRILPSS
jgi:4-amino-4-deoxy-L-arabinose transferase-like glycosyltransferase